MRLICFIVLEQLQGTLYMNICVDASRTGNNRGSVSLFRLSLFWFDTKFSLERWLEGKLKLINVSPYIEKTITRKHSTLTLKRTCRCIYIFFFKFPSLLYDFCRSLPKISIPRALHSYMTRNEMNPTEFMKKS